MLVWPARHLSRMRAWRVRRTRVRTRVHKCINSAKPHNGVRAGAVERAGVVQSVWTENLQCNLCAPRPR